jgi:hypothetical protein
VRCIETGDHDNVVADRLDASMIVDLDADGGHARLECLVDAGALEFGDDCEIHGASP